eukprot:3703619-Amphidinium_carterae.1
MRTRHKVKRETKHPFPTFCPFHCFEQMVGSVLWTLGWVWLGLGPQQCLRSTACTKLKVASRRKTLEYPPCKRKEPLTAQNSLRR